MEADGPPARVLLADRGYDSDAIRQDMEARGGVAVIPARRTRKVRESVDAHIYALRNRIERCFNRMKNARRVATRYDKTADSYRGFVQIVSIRLSIRDFVNTPYGDASMKPAARRWHLPSRGVLRAVRFEDCSAPWKLRSPAI